MSNMYLQNFCTILMAMALLVATRTALLEILIATLSLATLLSARCRVGVFGLHKKRLKGEGAAEYIQAMNKTEDIKYNMLFLALTWVVTGVLALLVTP